MKTLQISLSDTDLSTKLSDFITKEKLFKVVYISSNVEASLTNFIAKQPDLIILDSKLTSTEGHQLINLFSCFNLNSKASKVFVFSNSPKKFKNTVTLTSLKMPNSFSLFKDAIIKIYGATWNSASSNIVIPTSQNDWNNILLKLGFTFRNIGTTYLSYALSKSSNLKFSMKNIYNMISKQYKTTPEQAKWAIQKAVEQMRSQNNINRIYSNIPSYDGKDITTKYLISSLLNIYSQK